jgi:hypothetical protein
MKNNYINEYNKTHYKQFKVFLKPEEYKLLEERLKALKMSKIDFIRDAIDKLVKK